jgi:hypothetical protein
MKEQAFILGQELKGNVYEGARISIGREPGIREMFMKE